MGWSRFDGDGPPSAATLAAESAASQPPLYPAISWDELNRARFICWPGAVRALVAATCHV
jgi:hypothetical protein